jgi:hypothetical protein
MELGFGCLDQLGRQPDDAVVQILERGQREGHSTLQETSSWPRGHQSDEAVARQRRDRPPQLTDELVLSTARRLLVRMGDSPLPADLDDEVRFRSAVSDAPIGTALTGLLAEGLPPGCFSLDSDGSYHEVELQPAGTSKDAAHGNRDARRPSDNRWAMNWDS